MMEKNEESETQYSEQTSLEDEPFAIIDETGEGFGFELTPEKLMKPIAIGAASLFGIGMLAGIPMGIAMGRTQQDKTSKASKTRPTFDGLKFAATTFGLGTVLCGVMGVAGFYGIKWYYDVESFDQFGQVMRKSIPQGRSKMENTFNPLLNSIRRNAGENLPQPVEKAQTWFEHSFVGKWIKDQVDKAVVVQENTNSHNLPQQEKQDQK